MVKGTIRGHLVWYDQRSGEWLFLDTGEPVTLDRDCGRCKLPMPPNDHDPCIQNLPGVRNACCGHGEPGEAYVQFKVLGYVFSVRGKPARLVQRILGTLRRFTRQ